MVPSMFPAIFVFTLIVLGILYLTAAKIFQARKEKYLESVQDWKNFYRKMGPNEGITFLGKRIGSNFFKNCSDAELEAINQMVEEWFPERKEESRIH